MRAGNKGYIVQEVPSGLTCDKVAILDPPAGSAILTQPKLFELLDDVKKVVDFLRGSFVRDLLERRRLAKSHDTDADTDTDALNCNGSSGCAMGVLYDLRNCNDR